MTIVVTGGSGFIGTALTTVLLAKGHTVIVIDKHGPMLTHKDLFFIPCDLETSTLPFNVLERTDAIIHLAGRHIPSASDEPFAKEGIDTVKATAHVIESLEQTTSKPPIFISASSLGYYGVGHDREIDERSAVGVNKAAHAIEAQEKEVLKAERLGCRVVIIRTAPVIGRGGFMLPLLRAAKFHITFRLTKDDFWMPWIHLNDLIHIYLFALETNTLQGAVNAVSPSPIHYQEFVHAFSKTTHSMRLPLFPIVRWSYREMKRDVLIQQKVIPQRLLDKGFAFAYTNINEAIADTVHRPKHHEKN